MNCPVQAIDHESALVQADWYEEQGEQHTADEIREMLSHKVGAWIHTPTSYKNIPDNYRSYCTSRGSRTLMGSWCHSSSSRNFYSGSFTRYDASFTSSHSNSRSDSR